MRVRFSAVVAAVMLIVSAQQAESRATTNYDVAKGSRPALASAAGSQLYAVFEACDGGKQVPDIFCSTSSDFGITWSARQNISRMQGTSEHPAVAVEKSGAVDIVWSDNSADPKSPDIFFARSTDGGKTWTAPLDISNTPGVSAEPAIAIGPDDSIHVVFTDTSTGDANKDIYYVSSRDGGKKWSQDPLLPAIDISNTPGVSTEPTIIVTLDGIVHAAWRDTTSGETHPDIYYVRFERNSWTKALDVSMSARVSTHPTLTADRGKLFLAWSDNSRKEDAADIWVDVGNRKGKFSKPINISDTPGWSSEPAAVASNGQLVIVWTDTSTGTLTPSIYARVSPDGAQDFTNVLNVSQMPGMSKHPSVTISGGKMIVVWESAVGDDSTIKATSIELKGLPTGPPMQVDPTLHGVTGNAH